MAPTGKALFATALILAVSGLQSIAPAASRGMSGSTFSTTRGPGVLRSTDQGRTWSNTSPAGPKSITTRRTTKGPKQQGDGSYDALTDGLLIMRYCNLRLCKAALTLGQMQSLRDNRTPGSQRPG
jgi:hypothetical protein